MKQLQLQTKHFNSFSKKTSAVCQSSPEEQLIIAALYVWTSGVLKSWTSWKWFKAQRHSWCFSKPVIIVFWEHKSGATSDIFLKCAAKCSILPPSQICCSKIMNQRNDVHVYRFAENVCICSNILYVSAYIIIYHYIPKYSIVRFVSTLPFQRRLTL